MEPPNRRRLFVVICAGGLAATACISSPSACNLAFQRSAADDQGLPAESAPVELHYTVTPHERPQTPEPAEPDRSSFGERLRRATAGTWLRVRPGGHCGESPSHGATLATNRDPGEVAEFVRGIEVAESGSECACCGSRTLEFYRGDDLVLSLSVHHGTRLRWTDGPGRDSGMDRAGARLTDRGAEFLSAWLLEHAGGSSQLYFIEDPGVGLLSGPDAPQDPGRATVSLPTIVVTPEGFEVRVYFRARPEVCADYRSAGLPHDFEWLRVCTGALAWDFPEARAAVIIVARDVPYDVMVRTFQVVRGDAANPRFPRLVLGFDAWSNP